MWSVTLFSFFLVIFFLLINYSVLFYSLGRDIQEFDLDSLNSGSTSTSSRDRPKSPNSSLPHHRNANLNLQIPEGSNPSSDGASDTASNGSSAAAIDYTGPKLFVKPAAKSNRGIIINAINTVLAGAVNSNTKKNVLEVCVFFSFFFF